MSLFKRFGQALQDQYIARPDDVAGSLIWRFPNQNIVQGTRCTVRSDEEALFFRDGRLVGRLAAGAYHLSSQNIPWLTDLLLGPLTGGNQYIAELFFVRKAEFLHALPEREIGTVQDQNSHLLVKLRCSARFALQVVDPVALITQLGGQDSASEARALEFVTARITSALKTTVGKLSTQAPVLHIASNAHSEDVGQFVRERIAGDFATQGLELSRFLELHISLDPASNQQLTDFGAQEANLTISSRGAQIAAQPGYQTFQLVQGQRAALEGLGAGLAAGNVHGPVLGLGMGLGMAMPARPQRIALAPPGAAVGCGLHQPAGGSLLGGGAAAGPSTYFMRTVRGEEGPYKARQVALRILADHLDAGATQVRGDGDPDWFSAHDEPSIRNELERRQQRSIQSAPQPGVAFESLFATAVADSVLTEDELQLLANAMVAAGLAPGPGVARDVLLRRARAYGCRVPGDPPAPVAPATQVTPPLPATLHIVPTVPLPEHRFSYFDGTAQRLEVPCSEIARLLLAQPAAVHLVWAPGFPAWVPAADVEAIASLIQ